MKFRDGFVSNSSSSSFIISMEHFSTIKDLATYMIQQQMDDSDDSDDPSWHDKYIEQNKLYIERLRKLDENQAVSFPSCNYDTYIKKIGDIYLVSTCNNTDWNLWKYSTNKLSKITREELEKIQKTYSENDENYRDISYILDNGDYLLFGNDYYNLYKDIIGVETYEDCPKRDNVNYEHDHYLWNTPKYGKICPKCHPYYQRKDKLDIINQISKEE